MFFFLNFFFWKFKRKKISVFIGGGKRGRAGIDTSTTILTYPSGAVGMIDVSRNGLSGMTKGWRYVWS